MAGRKVPELYYRCSRICRVLGNPTAYQILKLLTKGGKTPSAMADVLKLSLPTVSIALRHLRQIDLVRYENTINGKVYSLKDKAIVPVLEQLEVLVKRQRSREY
ncbi:winged helix-turn-helix transcriptional regulator [candidate division WOR-3 bacterium]|nr:winged helix-turn-helix transcriptional regulator [candidate division WOR-3 bacterium]